MGLKEILFRTQSRVERRYSEYLTQWKKCVDSFESAMGIYLEKGNTEEFAFWVENTHKQESLADDIRRDIEFRLYAKAMLPESRGDILGLLETVDKVINKAESVLYQIHLEGIVLPELMRPHVQRIYDITRSALSLTLRACEAFFGSADDILELAGEIDRKESECDHAERAALKELFDSALPWHTKFQLKNLTIEMGNITDRTEYVSDRLVIVSVKRRV